MNQESTPSSPLRLFLSNLIADKAPANGQPPLLLQDNARLHVIDHQLFVAKCDGTPSNSFHKRHGAARWNDSFEVNEHNQSSSSLLVSPNSVVSLDRLVSPRRRASIIGAANSSVYNQQFRMGQHTITGTTAAFLASLPMDDRSDECR
jgi:hypothetical protein